MLLSPHVFRVKVRCCFDHPDTSGLHFRSKHTTPLDGAPTHDRLSLVLSSLCPSSNHSCLGVLLLWRASPLTESPLFNAMTPLLPLLLGGRQNRNAFRYRCYNWTTSMRR